MTKLNYPEFQDAQKGHYLSKMLAFASTKHEGQFDKSGAPYILHPLAVMYQLRTDDEELMCIALGHDLVEDCEVTYEELAVLGFTGRIIDGIRCLTKIPGETYEEYKAKVKSNIDSIYAKMEDLLHNSDLRRLKGVTQKDLDRMNRYMQFYSELKTELARRNAS